MPGWSRRELIVGAGAALLASPGRTAASADFGLTPEQRAAGERFLRRHASIDIHCHPGRFFMRGLETASLPGRLMPPPDEATAARELHAGMVSAALFAGVADTVLLDVAPGGGLHATRSFAPGEAWADFQHQLGALRALSANPLLARGRSNADIDRARKRRRTACVFAIEGGDFIEDRLDRIDEAHAAGVRSITLVHYRVNALGDIQTAAPVHGGLTATGRQAVRAMNRAGILIDAAHASFDTTRGIVDTADRPIMLSHSNLQDAANPNPRLISAEHARLIAATGGLVGTVPWGINQASASDWIDSLFRLVDAIGIEHVGIGTDMDASFRPVLTSYRDWPAIPAALLARGMREHEAAAVMGGNFLRVFARAG